MKNIKTFILSLFVCFLMSHQAQATECVLKGNCERVPQGPLCLGPVEQYRVIYGPCSPKAPYDCYCGCLEYTDCDTRKGMLDSGPKCVISFTGGMPHCGCYTDADCAPDQTCSRTPGGKFLTCIARVNKEDKLSTSSNSLSGFKDAQKTRPKQR